MKKQAVTIEPFGEVTVTTSPRSRSVKIKVVNGSLVASKPKYVPLSAVSTFIRKNEAWVQKQIDKSKEETVINDGDIVGPNSRVFFQESENEATAIEVKNDNIYVTLASTSAPGDTDVQADLIRELKKIWRKASKAYIPVRLDKLATEYGFEYNQLRLKDIRTRWGSCSSKGNININIQLIKLDEELIDHVLLHELSHTKALNHGPDFWEVFEGVRPGAKQERKQLKQMTIF